MYNYTDQYLAKVVHLAMGLSAGAERQRIWKLLGEIPLLKISGPENIAEKENAKLFSQLKT